MGVVAAVGVVEELEVSTRWLVEERGKLEQEVQMCVSGGWGGWGG